MNRSLLLSHFLVLTWARRASRDEAANEAAEEATNEAASEPAKTQAIKRITNRPTNWQRTGRAAFTRALNIAPEQRK
jgi:hypothetical protein